MYEVSNQFKAYCKRHIRTFKSATITYYEGNEQQTIESEDIIKFDISAEPYIDYQIIGQAVAKKIHISIRGSYDLANKEINVTTTMIYDDNTEEVLNLGNYIIASDYDSSVKNQCSFTGYDYMIKMDDEYSDEGLTYPCTIQDVIENICEQKDIELATTDLPNGDLEVIGNNFQDGATYRDVIKQIAQVNGTFAYIDRENKLHIDTLMNHETLQGEGTSITLSGTTAYGNIIDYILEGNTIQNGTPTPSSPVEVNNVTGEQVVTICGKNRIKFVTAKTSVVAGVTVTCDNNSTFTINGTKTLGVQLASSFDLQPTKLIGQYKFTGYTRQDAYVLLYCKDKNGTIKYTVLSGNPTITFNEGDYLFQIIIYINADVSATFNNETFHFQLEKGNTATPYTPNQEQNFEINLGKNLLKTKTLVEATTNGITFTPVYDGNKLQYVNVNGTATATAVYNLDSANIDYINTYANELPSGTYILDDFSGSTSPYMAIFFRYYTIGSTSTTTIDSVDNSRKLTIDSTIKYASYIRIHTGTTVNNMKFYPQLEKGNIETTYAPYFEPIELNKIGDYQDFIRKGTGKNLFDGQLELGMYDTTTGEKATNNANYRNVEPINVQPSTTYTFSINGTSQKYVVYFYKKDGTFIGVNTLSSGTFITPAETYLLNFRCFNADFTSDYANLKIQLEKSSSATFYEPYGYKNKWYIEKNIGKIVLDGINNKLTYKHPSITSETKGFYMFGLPNKILGRNGSTSYGISNYFSYIAQSSASQAFSNNTSGLWWEGSTNWNYMILEETSLSDANTWLTTHNTKVYYVLANPIYTLIENEELIEQLNALNNGYVYGTNANISVSGKIPSIINISVDAPGRDVEDEITPSSYLTDFKQSREYGPVNRVQITMTDIEDATYIENAESISKDGIQTITINDNYFLSSEELKAKAIRPLWNSLYTMKYMPISCKYLGLPYIEMNDYIGVVLPNEDVTGTYVFNYKFTYNGGYMGELETPTISRTQETYPTESINSQVQKMGINVDRANARITSEIIARQETDENVTRIEQSIDEINLSVSTTQTDLSNLEGQVQTNTASISVNADNISLAVEKNTQTQDQLDTLQTNTENVVNQLVFNGDGLTISALGSASDDMKLNLTNDAINFMYNNNVVLKINGSTIEFANASFQKLDLGNYVWVAEDDDSLSLIYEGE